MIEARPATAADIRSFYGDDWPTTMRAMVVLMDGKLAGIAGIVREGPGYKLFSDSIPELEPHLRSMTVLRAVKKVLEFTESSRLPVAAVSDNPDLLKRFGFRHVGGDEYLWDPYSSHLDTSTLDVQPRRRKERKPSSSGAAPA